MATRVLLVEDHNVVREALRALLDAEVGIEVVAETSKGGEAATLARRQRPDVVVVDIMLPDVTGFEVIREVRLVRPHPSVIVLSMYANEEYVIEALRLGASGYVLKQAPVGDLVRGVREVCGGRRYLSPPLSEDSLRAYAQRSRGDGCILLTGREREVVRLVALGRSNVEIASSLCLSHRTVEGYRAAAMRKLGCHKQADLIRYALSRGLIRIDSSETFA